MTTTVDAVRLSGLRKAYGEVRAVDGVDLTLAAGEVAALLGPNGAGKSTTVDLLLGLTAPDAGRIEIFGDRPQTAVRKGAVGAMLQEGTLLEDATVGEMVAMAASLHHHPLPVPEVLRRAGIEDLAGRRSARLSGGQKQRVRFALALVSEPGLLVLDEPTAAMDVGARQAFWAAMRRLTGAGRTVLFATHYLREAEDFADRVVLMRSGKIVADGPVAQVTAAAGGRTVRATVPFAEPAELAALPGVSRAEARGERVELACSDPDTAVRALLAAFPQARDIEIGSAGLEQAFLALTGESEAELAEEPAGESARESAGGRR